MRNLLSCLCVALWLSFLNPVVAEETASQTLAPVIAAIEKALAEKKSPVVVSDLDGTLFDTAQRNVRILREWAQENASNTDARIIEKVADKDAAYSIGDTLKNLGVTNATTSASVHDFWFKRFFTNEYVVIDAPIPGAPDFIKKCHDKGAVIVYLTGRDVPQMGKGTEESLRKNGFPVDEKTVVLMLKPSPEIKDFVFKKDACEKIGKLGVVVAMFENQPRNLNGQIKNFPDAIPVFVETNYDLKDTEVPSEKAIRIKNFAF
ncbi:MAG: HAD family hydrolase [Candidatus Ozemobacteraceae bacterium]